MSQSHRMPTITVISTTQEQEEGSNKKETTFDKTKDVIFGPGGIANTLRKGSFYRQLVLEHYMKIGNVSSIGKYIQEHLINPIVQNNGRFYYIVRKMQCEVLDPTIDNIIIQKKIQQALRDEKKKYVKALQEKEEQEKNKEQEQQKELDDDQSIEEGSNNTEYNKRKFADQSSSDSIHEANKKRKRGKFTSNHPTNNLLSPSDLTDINIWLASSLSAES